MILSQIHDNSKVVIAYAGRRLNAPEQHYSATEREALLAFVAGIKHFQPHLELSLSIQITMLYDGTGRLARWSLYLQQCDFDIQHRAGKNNAEALPRRPYSASISALET